MIKLYNVPVSGNAYRIRLMLSLLHVPFEAIDLDLTKKEQMTPHFMAINPLHKVPVIDDNGFVLRDSAAILVYLAEKYGKGSWYPKDAEGRGEVQQWLSLAVNEINNGLANARAIVLFKRPVDPKLSAEVSQIALHAMQVRLHQRDWLATGEPTIADIACYPYAALAYQAGIALHNHPAVARWIKRVEALPGYVAMAGLPWPGDPVKQNEHKATP